MRRSRAQYSSLLFITSGAIAACGGAPTSADVESTSTGQSEDRLIGGIEYGGTCTVDNMKVMDKAVKYGRIVAISPAVSQCIDQAWSTGFAGLGGQVGPFVACHDITSTYTPSYVKGVLATRNTLKINCTGGGDTGNASANLDTYGHTGLETFSFTNWLNAVTPEGMKPDCNGSNGPNCRSGVWPFDQAAGIAWHEVMHQRGYTHPETGAACGLLIGSPPYNFQVNTVPYIVQGCISEVIDRSVQRCGFPLETCGPNAMKVISSFGSNTCTCRTDPRKFVPGDYFGTGLTSLALWRGSTGGWTLMDPHNWLRNTSAAWGGASVGDIPVSGDFDGDRIADRAVWRGPEGGWHITKSTGGETHVYWGSTSNGDVPVPGDYDGDGKTDFGIWRGPDGGWHIKRASGGEIHDVWGNVSIGDIPVPGDYDGDGVYDIAVWRASTGDWHIKAPSGEMHEQWGTQGDIPVPGDYDGDGKTDFAVYRPWEGKWYIKRSLGLTRTIAWGSSVDNDVPVPGDYDGDGVWDAAVYRPAQGFWHISTTSSGELHDFSFSGNLDQPVLKLIHP